MHITIKQGKYGNKYLNDKQFEIKYKFKSNKHCKTGGVYYLNNSYYIKSQNPIIRETNLFSNQSILKVVVKKSILKLAYRINIY